MVDNNYKIFLTYDYVALKVTCLWDFLKVLFYFFTSSHLFEASNSEFIEPSIHVMAFFIYFFSWGKLFLDPPVV